MLGNRESICRFFSDNPVIGNYVLQLSDFIARLQFSFMLPFKKGSSYENKLQIIPQQIRFMFHTIRRSFVNTQNVFMFSALYV